MYQKDIRNLEKKNEHGYVILFFPRNTLRISVNPYTSHNTALPEVIIRGVGELYLSPYDVIHCKMKIQKKNQKKTIAVEARSR
jgi:hypothetical protein